LDWENPHAAFSLGSLSLQLQCHRDSQCDALSQITVSVERLKHGALSLRYHLRGRVGGVLLAPLLTSKRQDNLWKTTCLEVFVRSGSDQSYREFNFAPSGNWAAYQFADYRADMISPPGIVAPRIGTKMDPDCYEMDVLVATGLPDIGTWDVGVSAIIEETDGRKSYWALAHPPGKADFHHPDGFTHRIKAVDFS
jgi:hypothetical protein